MIREPFVAGQFYPGDKKTLTNTVDDLLNNTPKPEISGNIIAIAVPHAGYPYSGATAAFAYKAVAGQNVNTVILLGPTHRVFFKGAAVYGKGSWKTPLGEVLIDEKLAQGIITHSKVIQHMPDAHQQEHSLEVQIPFLQKTFKAFKIVPIMLLEPSYEECEILAQAIAKHTKDKNILLLASSDLYHGNSYKECKKTDSITLSYLQNFDPSGLYKALQQGKAQACGGYPIVVLMLTSKLLGADQSKVLHQTNSNDVIGEKGGYCVGYASAVFYQSVIKQGNNNSLTVQEKKELLRIARTTIENHIAGKKVPEFTPLTDKLKEKYGVFVTLKKSGNLRGCIGYIEGVEPLYKAVSRMAIAASSEDPRFPKVTPAEVKDITIEITVMTPLKKVSNINEIQVGKHGIVIQKGYNRGLLLPHVATEEGWSRETFLGHTCRKAGLPENAWKDKNTEIYIFSGTIFSEDE